MGGYGAVHYLKKKTRWVDNKNDPTSMEDALKFLETFEIESETEATTISKLCEKMIADMKLYMNKAKEKAIFSAKVAKAQDVAMSLTQMAAKKPMPLMKLKPKIPSLFNRPPTLPENVNLINKAGGPQSAFPRPNAQNMNAMPGMPMAPPYQQAMPRPGMRMAPPYQQAMPRPGMRMAPPNQQAMPGMRMAPPNQQAMPGMRMAPPNQQAMPGMRMAPPYQQAMPGMPMAPPYQQAMPGMPMAPPCQQAMPGMPMAPPHQQAQPNPSVPLNQQQSMQAPLMPLVTETPQTSDDPLLKNITPEDTRFFKKLLTLLEALPQSASSTETSELNSKLMMLKSLLVKEKNAAHEQANQKLMMQIASMVQNTLSAQNASVTQQLMMLMAARNTAAVPMPTGNLMAPDGVVPGIPSLGTMPTNVNSLPLNQSVGGQTFGQIEGNASMSMDQNAYQAPMQNYPGSSQNYDHFAFGNSVAENYVPQENSYAGRHGGVDNPPTTRPNAQKPMPYTDVGYESSAGGKEWDEYYGSSSTQVSEPRYDDYAERKAAYAGRPLSPSSPRNRYENTSGEMRTQNPKPRPNLRSYDSFDWDDDEVDIRYNKHPRLEVDKRSDTSKSYHTQSLESLGIDTTGMPNELIKRLQGKDLFTAAAIVSEYSERRSGK
ncbi:bromodomain-containing protein 4-like [Eleutherodactylus coqui]|uniref:bromodomain-containing protein 4-like n=1 Tax=Eleutherodactylus coqui TaxID=57060 RepID=UPI003461F0B8